MENPLVAGGLTLVFLGIGSMFGSVGIVVAGTMLVAIGISSGQSDGESTTPAEKTNCPSCGARNKRETDVCHHCGTVLSGK
ncbi:hypothetical protein [Haladaptatus sp.]|uniref:hypothetical protein n=1 Tax=Haladaptatus sp. TaxID=1973141 RepID=UPI003C3F1C35